MSVTTTPATGRPETDRPAPATPGPWGRIVSGSVAAGLISAVALVATVGAGAAECVVTALLLLAFGLGWALLGLLSARFTDRPQGWTVVPAAAMAGTAVGLLTAAPDTATMSTLGWVWPVPTLGLAVWSAVQIRRHLPRRGRWILAPVVAVLALAPLAATYENVVAAHDRETFRAAPGTTYVVDGHRLHLDCRGQGGPTVVLENGLGEVSASWSRVVAQVGSTRVCTYDRAGQGWSDDAGHQDGIAAAHDLHAALAVAGEHGPYVLVGHSIGGPYALVYASEYPDDVAGMVLLDSSSPEQFTVIPSYAGQYAVMRRALAAMPLLNGLGLGRLTAAVSPSHLPAAAGSQVEALTASARAAADFRAEWNGLPVLFDQAQAVTSLGTHPLVVLTASESLDDTGGWAEAQRSLAALSDNRQERVVESTHAGLLEDPHGAAESARAIAETVAAIHGGTDLPRR